MLIKNEKSYFIDLFAGAGGLSEGFIQIGFNPIAQMLKWLKPEAVIFT